MRKLIKISLLISVLAILLVSCTNPSLDNTSSGVCNLDGDCGLLSDDSDSDDNSVKTQLDPEITEETVK